MRASHRSARPGVPSVLTILSVLPALAIVVLCTSAPPAMAGEGEPTLDELVAKNLEARGGAEAWETVENARIEARMLLPGDQTAPMVFTFAEPDKMRVDLTIQGSKIVQGYDGEVGWQVLPLFGDSAGAQELGDDELEQMLRQDFFHGLLQSYEEKGFEAEYLGLEPVDGEPAHAVRIVFDPETGDDVLVYLDPETYLEVLQVVEATSPQTGTETEILVKAGDFREVDGLVLAHRYELIPTGAPSGQTIEVRSVEINSDAVDDDLFAMPAPPSPSASPEAGDAASDPASDQASDQ